MCEERNFNSYRYRIMLNCSPFPSSVGTFIQRGWQNKLACPLIQSGKNLRQALLLSVSIIVTVAYTNGIFKWSCESDLQILDCSVCNSASTYSESQVANTGIRLGSLGPAPAPIASSPPDYLCKHSFNPPGSSDIGGHPLYQSCAVCYLPVEEAVAAKPSDPNEEQPLLKGLKFANSDHLSEQLAAFQGKPQRFGGYPSLRDRSDSFVLRENMTVHCGFLDGREVGAGPGFNVSKSDRVDMDACDDVVVATAIFGAYDSIREPENLSEEARMNICFFLFMDHKSWADLTERRQILPEAKQKVGVWRIVLLGNSNSTDPRRMGKIPKLLLHRLFPNVRYSLWLDGKLKLRVDPYQVLERFLWRERHTFSISNHYLRSDAFSEAEVLKASGRYNNTVINMQMESYRMDGFMPYSENKLPIISDVPDGCVIMREHTHITNIFSCLWFNEVDRFAPRDQLSFGFLQSKILHQVPWKYKMYLNCERCNFVLQGLHHK